MLYEAFDNFLKIDTWYTRHEYDEERFFVVLNSVVKDPKFNPETMGEYMREKKGLSRDDENNAFNIAIDRYVVAAWAVKQYLEANNL